MFCFRGTIFTMRDRIIVVSGLLSAIVLLSMIVFSTPLDVGPLGVLVFFTMVYVAFYSFLFSGLKLIRKIIHGDSCLKRREYIRIAVASFGSILFLLMNSFRFSMMISAAIALVFAVLGCFLLRKKNF